MFLMEEAIRIKRKSRASARTAASIVHRSDDCHFKKDGSKGKDNNNKNRNAGGGNKKFLKCAYCKKSGHTEDSCWKKAADEKKGEAANMAKEEHVIICVEIDSDDDDSVPPPLISRRYTELDDSSNNDDNDGNDSIPSPLISRKYADMDDSSDDDDSVPPLTIHNRKCMYDTDSLDDDSVPPLMIGGAGWDTDSSNDEPPALLKAKNKENKYFTGIPREGDRRAYVCFYVDSDSDDSDDEDDIDDDDSFTGFDFNEGFYHVPIQESHFTKSFDFNSAPEEFDLDSKYSSDESIDNVMDFEDPGIDEDNVEDLGKVHFEDVSELEGFELIAEPTTEFGNTCNVSMAQDTTMLLKEIKDTKDLWIADTGATCHLTNREDGMTKLTSSDKEIHI